MDCATRHSRLRSDASPTTFGPAVVAYRSRVKRWSGEGQTLTRQASRRRLTRRGTVALKDRPGERESVGMIHHCSMSLPVDPSAFAGFRFPPEVIMLADHRGYHMVMTRREVLVQLDDDLVERLDALAADLGTNRSELMRRGAQAILEAEDLASKDRQLQLAYRRQPADPVIVESARRLAARTAPQW